MSLNTKLRWICLLLLPVALSGILHNRFLAMDALQRLPLPMPEEMTLPLDLQITILFKAVTFDLSHEKDFKQAGYRIAVVYAPDQISSSDIPMRVIQQLAEYPQNRPLTRVQIPFTNLDQFRESIRVNRINIVYICPGTSRNLVGILEVSKEFHVLTATGVEQYVKDGVALGFIGVRDKNNILMRYSVNRSSSKFDADFLDSALKTYQ